jgi:hypothetical protein
MCSTIATNSCQYITTEENKDKIVRDQVRKLYKDSTEGGQRYKRRIHGRTEKNGRLYNRTSRQPAVLLRGKWVNFSSSKKTHFALGTYYLPLRLICKKAV